MEIRDKIWSLINDSKYKEYCIGFKVEQFQHRDRNINLFLALTSSGSIAGWAVWDKYYFLWAIIIAASQIINVIKPYFPFHKYIKDLNSKLIKIENINLDFEQLWFSLQTDKISEDKAEKQYFALKKQLVEIQRFRDDTIFKVGDKTENKANLRMITFLKNTYNVELKIEENGKKNNNFIKRLFRKS